MQIAAGVPIVTVAGRAGHARTSTTTDIYSHFLKQPTVPPLKRQKKYLSKIRTLTTQLGSYFIDKIFINAVLLLIFTFDYGIIIKKLCLRFNMALSYNKFWKLLIDKGMTKTDLRLAADIYRHEQENGVSVVYKMPESKSDAYVTV